MPDKKPTDSEILKAFTCCDVGDCEDCSLRGERCGEIDVNEEILDLINRLQAENERLKEEKSKLENKIDEIYPLVMQLPNAMQQAKAEAYKECIEKVNNKIRFLENRGFSIHYVVKDALNNLLKEMVGEQPILNDVKCIDCEYLELELPYAVCSKAYKGIVAPDDSCGKGKLKELVGEDNV